MAVGQGKLGSTLELLIELKDIGGPTEGRAMNITEAHYGGGIEVYVVSEERRYSIVVG